MKKQIIFGFFIIFISWAISSKSSASDLQAIYDAKKLSLDVSGGYRIDKMDWNVASDISGVAIPDIAREVKWSKLQVYQYKATANIPIFSLREKPQTSYKPYYIDKVKLDQQNLFLSASYAKGNISSGSNRDSQYSINGRGGQTAQLDADSGGSVQDIEASLNYDVVLKYMNWATVITPLAGYAQYQQNLTMTNGIESISSPGNRDNLNSTFDSKWKGPFAGLKLSTIYDDTHIFSASARYYYMNYDAVADWSLETGLAHPKSFAQKATGSGTFWSVEYGYKVFRNFTLNFSVDHKKFTAEDGTQTSYNSNNTTSEAKLNNANWSSTSAMVGFKLNF